MGELQFGKKTCVFAGFICLVLVAVECSDSKLEVKGNSTEKNDGSNPGLVKKDTEQVEKSKGIVQNVLEKSNLSQPVAVIDDHTHGKNDAVSSKGKVKDNVSEEKGKTVDGSESKNTVKEEGTGESSGSSTTVEKREPQAGECDSSNMCVDEKSNLVACLQVPGNDSPDLLLLIQNRGKRPLTVGIAAPEFVQLEKTKVQLRAKEDKKVKVSIGYNGIDSLIVLTTNEGHCTLDFRDLVPRDPNGETHYSYKLNYLTSLAKTRYTFFVFVTIIFILASCWMCVSFGRKYFLKNGYQEVEMELPDSFSGQSKTDTSIGAWDDEWDDGWEDEEAPKTPTLPATPNLSSRGLASRRLSKEGWKD